MSHALFYTLTACSIFSIFAAVLVFPTELPIYFREHLSYVYRSDTYYLSKLLNEIPILIILPTIHAVIIYYMIGFGCDLANFAFFLIILVLISNAGYSIGHILSAVSSDVNMAVSLTAPVVAVQMLFSGFYIKKALRTPKWMIHFKYFSIFNYGFDLLLINQWEKASELKCEYDLEVLCMMTGKSVLEEAKVHSENKWLYLSLLAALVVSFRVIAFTILWYKGRKDPLKIEEIWTRCKWKKKMFNFL